jgi:hypothetical protein
MEQLSGSITTETKANLERATETKRETTQGFKGVNEAETDLEMKGSKE